MNTLSLNWHGSYQSGQSQTRKVDRRSAAPDWQKERSATLFILVEISLQLQRWIEGLRSQVVLVSGSSPGQSPDCTKLYTLHSLQQRRLENWIKAFARGLSEKRAKASASSQLEGGGGVKEWRWWLGGGMQQGTAGVSVNLLTALGLGADEGTNATQGIKLQSSFDETVRHVFLCRKVCVFRVWYLGWMINCVFSIVKIQCKKTQLQRLRFDTSSGNQLQWSL